jgi:pantetheine-phosphate adenylyltransferase
MKKIAVFPGSFDPITQGHEAIVLRGLKIFDEIIVAIGSNSSKKYFFDLKAREKMVKATFKDIPNVRVVAFDELTIHLCKKMNAKFLLRGLRSSVDFEYEKPIAQMNATLSPDIESVFIITSPELSGINSTLVRDVLINKGDASHFLPKKVKIKK